MTLADQYADKLARPRCWPQCSPADWTDETAPPRKDWIRTVCRKCGTWIGDRRAERKQAATVKTEAVKT